MMLLKFENEQWGGSAVRSDAPLLRYRELTCELYDPYAPIRPARRLTGTKVTSATTLLFDVWARRRRRRRRLGLAVN